MPEVSGAGAILRRRRRRDPPDCEVVRLTGDALRVTGRWSGTARRPRAETTIAPR
jgi:hypothetical protein